MKKLAIVGAAVALLLVPAQASAAEIKHKGKIAGAKNSKVAFKVVTQQRTALRLKGFRAKRVPARCGGRPATVNSIRSNDPIRVDNNRFDATLVTPDGAKIFVKGTVKRKGKRTVGTIRTSRFDGGPGFGNCRVPQQRFRTKKA